MTQEEKQLLLVDLCARLPYGVFVNIEGFDYDFNGKLVQVYFGNINRCSVQVGSNISYSLEETKPWLRPMSSMTEDEKHYIDYEWGADNDGDITTYSSCEGGMSIVECACIVGFQDWLNKKMFDYRGLIKRGLALEAPKGMYEK